jgi:hypothetical protein
VLISAVVIPLLLLVAVFVPGLYRDWKIYSRRTRFPLPPARRSLRNRLLRAGAACLRRCVVWLTEHRGTCRPAGIDLPSHRSSRSPAGRASEEARANRSVRDRAAVTSVARVA